MTLAPFLIGDSVTLKVPSPEDAPALFALTEANRARLREWLPWVDANERVEDTARFIDLVQAEFAASQSLHYAIWQEDRLIGTVGLHRLDWPNRKSILGYWIDRAHEGRGLMRDAGTCLLRYAFDGLELNRIELGCGLGNARSEAVARALGFTYEGIARGAEWLNGRFGDHKVFSLLKTEFTPR